MYNDDEIMALLAQHLDENVDRFHDYGVRDLVRAFRLGFRAGVADGRPTVNQVDGMVTGTLVQNRDVEGGLSL